MSPNALGALLCIGGGLAVGLVALLIMVLAARGSIGCFAVGALFVLSPWVIAFFVERYLSGMAR